jgi:hypothetical protein
MTFEDIISLAKAGYTKDDISRLTQAADPKPDPEKKAQENPPEKAPESPAPAPAGDPAMTALQAQIDALKQMMQINNMLTVNQNAPKERTIDDIFAEIINPPLPENKDK